MDIVGKGVGMLNWGILYLLLHGCRCLSGVVCSCSELLATHKRTDWHNSIESPDFDIYAARLSERCSMARRVTEHIRVGFLGKKSKQAFYLIQRIPPLPLPRYSMPIFSEDFVDKAAARGKHYTKRSVQLSCSDGGSLRHLLGFHPHGSSTPT